MISHLRNIDGKLFEIFGYPEDKSVFNVVKTNGYYENNILDLLRNLLNQNSVCIDAGANIGMISIYMSLFTKGDIYAFEPSKDNYAALQKMIEYNKLDNVKAFNLALGNKTGKTNFVVNKENGGGSRIHAGSTYRPQKLDETVEVDIITLDDFVQQNDISKIDMLKMDVEGFEELVFEGGIKTIEKFLPDIISEFSSPVIMDAGLDQYKYYDILSKYYKHIYFIDRPLMRLVPLTECKQLEGILTPKYHNIGDIFCTNKELAEVERRK